MFHSGCAIRHMERQSQGTAIADTELYAEMALYPPRGCTAPLPSFTRTDTAIDTEKRT